MNINDVHDQLNQLTSDGLYLYQKMSEKKIQDLLKSCNCPVAVNQGGNVTLIDTAIDPKSSKVSVGFKCPYATKMNDNNIFTEVNCRILRRKCQNHLPHGDYELGFGVTIYPSSGQ